MPALAAGAPPGIGIVRRTDCSAKSDAAGYVLCGAPPSRKIDRAMGQIGAGTATADLFSEHSEHDTATLDLTRFFRGRCKRDFGTPIFQRADT